MNPTTDVLEQRLAAIEGGTGALAVASGKRQTTFAILNITEVGDEIVSANNCMAAPTSSFTMRCETWPGSEIR